MKKYDFLIVGSGLFGATVAHQITQKGKSCLVLEKRSHVGGNVYTECLRDITVHRYGAHIFHTNNKRVWEYINSFAEFNHFINSPIANYKGRLFSLPINMHTFYQLWGIVSPNEAIRMIERQKQQAKIKNPRNLEEKAISLVGKDIYELLIKGYTEKQWGERAANLPAFIICRLPVRFTFNTNYFSDRYQGIPKGGYTPIIEQMLQRSEVILNTDYFANKNYFDSLANKIIYTGMIDRYFNFCYGTLGYRSLKFDIKLLEGISNFQGNAVINYTDADTPYTRIVEHKHFEFGIQPDTIISYEYPQDFTKESEPFYPINNIRNNDLYQHYKQLSFSQNNVFFGGRLAEYKYYDMDDVIDKALSLAEQLC